MNTTGKRGGSRDNFSDDGAEAHSSNVERDRVRKRLLERRRSLSTEALEQAGRALANELVAAVLARSAKGGDVRSAKGVGVTAEGVGVIASYLAHRGEIDPGPGVELLRELGWRVVLPVCGDDGHMEFCPWDSDTAFVENRYGISEPDSKPVAIGEIDVVLVPAVAFDEFGNRLGHGVGFYDRFFARCAQQNHDPYRLGIAHEFQIVELPAPEPWDIPVHSVVSPPEVIDNTPCE